MINSAFRPRRFERVEIDLARVERALSTLERPSWNQFLSTISPIWASVLSGPGGAIKDVFAGDAEDIKLLYEDFFVNGLSDGAAVGAKMHELRSFLKIVLRERRRRNILRRIEFKQNCTFDYNVPDFGQAWSLSYDGNQYNFELTDHFYFADICYKIIKFLCVDDVVFLGDGCGYLAQSILSLDSPGLISKVTMIDLFHFLVRQYLLLDDFKEGVQLSYLNAEFDNCGPTSKSPKVLVNQDSLPEIDQKSQEKYFQYIRDNGVKALISYNKVDHSKGHVEFRATADLVFGKKLMCFESAMRPGYWIEVWHE